MPVPHISIVLITSTSGSRWPPTPDHRASPSASAAVFKVLATSVLPDLVAPSTAPAGVAFAAAAVLELLLCPPAVWKTNAARAANNSALFTNAKNNLTRLGYP